MSFQFFVNSKNLPAVFRLELQVEIKIWKFQVQIDTIKFKYH